MPDDPQPLAPPATYLGSWRKRRRVIYFALEFCGADLAYLSIFASDTALHQQIAIALVGAAVAIIGSYVFGAVFDDHSIRKAMN